MKTEVPNKAENIPDKDLFKGAVSNEVDYIKIAERITEKVPLYYDNSRIWYRWDKGKYKWQIVDEIEVLNSIRAEMSIAGISKAQTISELLNALKMVAREKRPKELGDKQIQFKSNIYNLQTGSREEATPKHFTFNPIPHDLGESEDTPIIDKLMKEWVGEKNVRMCYEWIAYNMLPDYPIHRAFILYGAGSNGKTSFIRLMRRLLGEDNIKAGDFETVFLERFGTSYLYRNLGIVCGETNFSRLERTSKFKSATGGDPILIEHKGKTGFTYINYAKISICTNSLPVTTDKTDGFYRRLTIIDFPNKFKEKVDLLSIIPDREYNNLALKCTRLLKELLKKAKFDNEGNEEQRRQRYEELSNPLELFIGEEITDDPDGQIVKEKFNKVFSDWQRKRKYRVWTPREIAKNMKDTGYQDRQVNTGTVNQEGRAIYKRAWLGLRWRGDEKELKEEDVR